MLDEAVKLNLHAIIPASRVNGPGTRLVVFFQGCRRHCPGCFNPDTHSFEMRLSRTVDSIFEGRFIERIDGITVSGGEPFMQAKGLCALLKKAKAEYGLSTVVYTGFKLEELRQDYVKAKALSHIDVLVDGAYDELLPEPTLLARGSTNQRFYFLSGRYCMDDLYMPARAEITIGVDGLVTGTGFGRIDIPKTAATAKFT